MKASLLATPNATGAPYGSLVQGIAVDSYHWRSDQGCDQKGRFAFRWCLAV